MKRFAFVMDPLEKLDLPWDTSLSLLRELVGRGHLCVLFTIPHLSLESGRITGWGQPLQPLGNHHYRQGAMKRYDFARFDVVLVRKDPPFDDQYLAMTYLLEPLAAHTRVINHPRGIRNANEKISGLRFSRWSPPTLVSACRDEILAFQKKIRVPLVVKPLYEKGGKGVILLKGRGPSTHAFLHKATKEGTVPVVAQEFIPAKGKEDKRILLWKGRILGAFARIPRPGEFRSNLSLGGRFTSVEISSGEKKLVQALRSYLLKEGLLFVGIDTRRGKLIEVNVTSPAGLVELEALYGPQAIRRMAADLERM